MENPVNRRSFLSRLGAGIGSLFVLPVSSFAQTSARKQPFIKLLQPMGFQWETADPFLFCAHHEDDYPKGNAQMGPACSLQGREMGNDFIIKDGFRMYDGKKVPGFPGHPHRGFETVTIVRRGLVDHADSLGAAGRYGNGDVQWMTAGSGVQHSEMFPLLRENEPNPLELFQVWLNLPKKNKMTAPHFKMLWSDTIPRVVQTDSKGKKSTVEVIAGKLAGKKAPTPPPNSWAADPANEVAILNIQLEAGATFVLPAASAGIGRNLYFYQGKSLKIGDTVVDAYHRIEVDGSKELQLVNGPDEGRILVLQGKPIGEHVVQYGPFVMNSKAEIQQAFQDYHKTQFGGWPWPRYDQVHDRKLGRFAQHADGKRETRG